MLFGLLVTTHVVVWTLTNPRRPEGKVVHLWTIRAQMLAAIIVYTATIAERLNSGTSASPLALGTGAFTASVGAWLQWRARADLGRYWSLHIEIRPDHRLVDSGLYRYLRHPTYLGWFLVFLALPLGLGSRWGVVAWLLATIPAVLVRWQLEESTLVRALGESYEAYCARTRAFWPRFGSRRRDDALRQHPASTGRTTETTVHDA
jgi:protein-S-isoprenylcysteine O-methyltransferase